MSKHAKAAISGRNMPTLNSVLLESKAMNSSFGSPGSPWGIYRDLSRASSPLPPQSIPSGSPLGRSPSFGRGQSPSLSDVQTVDAPPGWEPFFDPALGFTYYNNVETGETVWAVDKGWHEVEPSSADSVEPGSPCSPASARLRSSPASPLVDRAFDVISMEEGETTEDAADGWVLGVDRTTRALYKYHLKTGARRPWVE